MTVDLHVFPNSANLVFILGFQMSGYNRVVGRLIQEVEVGK